MTPPLLGMCLLYQALAWYVKLGGAGSAAGKQAQRHEISGLLRTADPVSRLIGRGMASNIFIRPDFISCELAGACRQHHFRWLSARDMKEPSSGEHAAAEVAKADRQEQGPECEHHGIDDVEVHVRCRGERGPHALVDVDQRVDQHERLE